jgi:hypothetical protein
MQGIGLMTGQQEIVLLFNTPARVSIEKLAKQ